MLQISFGTTTSPRFAGQERNNFDGCEDFVRRMVGRVPELVPHALSAAQVLAARFLERIAAQVLNRIVPGIRGGLERRGIAVDGSEHQVIERFQARNDFAFGRCVFEV